MLKKDGSKAKKPLGKAGRIGLSLLVTVVVGFLYFYLSLPAINPQSADFYTFLALLCVVYTLCIFVLSAGDSGSVVRTPKEKAREWLRLEKSS